MSELFFVSAMFFFVPAFAQTVVNVDNNNSGNSNIYGIYYAVSGVPFSPVKYVRVVSGSPYFSETWMKANLLLSNEKRCLGVVVRLDLLENKIEYIDTLGEKMIATTPVSELFATDTTTGESFRFVHSSKMPSTTIKLSPGWYQMLYEGSISLYKFVTKSMTESRLYGSATVEQSISGSSDYFVLFPTGIEKFKKLNALPGLLPDKKEQLKAFISDNKLNGKNDADFIALVAHYNSLK